MIWWSLRVVGYVIHLPWTFCPCCKVQGASSGSTFSQWLPHSQGRVTQQRVDSSGFSGSTSNICGISHATLNSSSPSQFVLPRKCHFGLIGYHHPHSHDQPRQHYVFQVVLTCMIHSALQVCLYDLCWFGHSSGHPLNLYQSPAACSSLCGWRRMRLQRIRFPHRYLHPILNWVSSLKPMPAQTILKLVGHL